MISFIGSLILLVIETILLVTFYKKNIQEKDIEIDKMRLTITELIQRIQLKNDKIKELQNEIKRENNTRLRKNH